MLARQVANANRPSLTTAEQAQKESVGRTTGGEGRRTDQAAQWLLISSLHQSFLPSFRPFPLLFSVDKWSLEHRSSKAVAAISAEETVYIHTSRKNKKNCFKWERTSFLIMKRNATHLRLHGNLMCTLYKRRKNNWATRTDGEGERDKGLYFQEDPLKGT